MRLPLHIASRYLFARKSHNVINIISAISAAGMAVGTAALILILSVYNGFDRIIKDNMSDVDPDLLIVRDDRQTFSCAEYDFTPLLDDARTSSVSTILEENVFISYAGRQGIAKAKGVDQIYAEESPLAGHVRSGEFSLSRGDVRQCVAGLGLAHNMSINPDFTDLLTVYYPDRTAKISLSNPGAALRMEKLRPSGIVSIGSEVDDALLIVPLETMRSLMLCPDGASALEVRTTGLDGKAFRRYAKETAEICPPGFKVLDRYMQNPTMYKMMRYEKAAIFLILLFVVLIVAVNIFGSLSMLRIEKEEDMETLRSMGADESLIRSIFRTEGMLISFMGMGIGLAAGVILALVQQHFGIVHMPGNYLITAYPVILKFQDVLLTAVGVSLAGLLISWPIPRQPRPGEGRGNLG